MKDTPYITTDKLALAVLIALILIAISLALFAPAKRQGLEAIGGSGTNIQK